MEISIQKDSKYFRISVDSEFWGVIYQSHNPYHAGNIYLNYTLEPNAALSEEISRELFHKIHQELDKPLQSLLNAEKTDLSAFLEAGGFQQMRRCYCMEVWPEDLKEFSTDRVELLKTHRGTSLYRYCAELLYQQYAQKHLSINPLTADFPAFCEALPETVLYQKNASNILHFAFIEENEIAYVGSEDPSRFSEFAHSLVTQLFWEHETLYFEADDCDAEAMALKALFPNSEAQAFDTYIRPKHRT